MRTEGMNDETYQDCCRNAPIKNSPEFHPHKPDQSEDVKTLLNEVKAKNKAIDDVKVVYSNMETHLNKELGDSREA